LPRASPVLGVYFKLCVTFIARTGPNQQHFQNITSSTGALWPTAFALLTLLFAPILIPVGAIFVLFHALRQPAGPHCQDATNTSPAVPAESKPAFGSQC
jgi:hypothetical protein